jgi:hypothetical protein
MRIAIDARELHGKPTGVGRFLGELLDAWKTMPEGQGHEFVLLAPEGATSDGGTLWEQMVLPTLARDAEPTCSSRPPTADPYAARSGWCSPFMTSFAAHPEWFARREGAAAVASCSWRARPTRVTISQFSKREIVMILNPHREDRRYPGVADLSSAARDPRVREPGLCSMSADLQSPACS